MDHFTPLAASKRLQNMYKITANINALQQRILLLQGSFYSKSLTPQDTAAAVAFLAPDKAQLELPDGTVLSDDVEQHRLKYIQSLALHRTRAELPGTPPGPLVEVLLPVPLTLS